MESSWLVQRLKKPYPKPDGHPLFGVDNPFAFGGGMKNGGLADGAMDLLRDIWQFDYMGAAEFEWGAVPEALQKIGRSDLTAFSFSVPLAEVPASRRDKSKKQPEGEAEIYVLCPQKFAGEARERIEAWAREEYPSLKEGLRLISALRPLEEWDRDVCGWLELDNGFLFFTDKEMWEKSCRLFGVESGVRAA